MAQKQPNAADKIIDRFGGTREMSRKTGWPPSTIQSWKDAGHIPAKRQPKVLKKAAEHDIPLEPADFFERADA